MARTKNQTNGRLDEVLISLAQSQASLVQSNALLVQNHATLVVRMAEMDQRFAQIDQRFAQIDQRFARIEAILLEHSRILQALPDAVRQKIGFRPPEST